MPSDPPFPPTWHITHICHLHLCPTTLTHNYCIISCRSRTCRIYFRKLRGISHTCCKIVLRFEPSMITLSLGDKNDASNNSRCWRLSIILERRQRCYVKRTVLEKCALRPASAWPSLRSALSALAHDSIAIAQLTISSGVFEQCSRHSGSSVKIDQRLYV